MGRLPIWIKIAYTGLVCLIVPVYWIEYGPQNFLWFSGLALIALVPAIWLEHRLLTSVIAVGTLAMEIAWSFDVMLLLITGGTSISIGQYMLDPQIPLFVRLLSLFHVILPPLMLWMLHRLGYDSRALPAQTIAAWIVLLATYALTDPEQNVNWVHGLVGRAQDWLPPPASLGLLMIALPAIVFLPTHWLLRKVFGSSG